MNRQAPIAPTRPATYQDVIDAPPHMVAEIIDGELVLQPRPASPHAFAGSSLGYEITGPFQRGRDGPGGWWIIDEPELHLGPQVLVPDLGGWRRETMPAYPDVPYFEQAPDWACEVLSPSTRRHDLTAKRDIYGRAGVGHLWFVDPLARTLEVFALREDVWTLVVALSGDDPVSAAPFDAVSFDLSALWPPESEGDAVPGGAEPQEAGEERSDAADG